MEKDTILKEYRIRYNSPFYCLQERCKIFYIFHYWNEIYFSHSLEEVESKYSKLQNS